MPDYQALLDLIVTKNVLDLIAIISLLAALILMELAHDPTPTPPRHKK